MAFRQREEQDTKFLEVTASMQGSLAFNDPVNLRINGRFEGTLQTYGALIIGERAQVRANIEGDTIVVAGQLQGELKARQRLELRATARVTGAVTTPTLLVEEGASFDGRCDMTSGRSTATFFTVEELARYLEMEQRVVVEWAKSGRLPALREGEAWKFERAKIEEWVANEKVR